MSRAQTNRLYTNFTKGLITEASPLAYPEGASLDEDNMEMLTNGDRVRRYGLDSGTASAGYTAILWGLAPNLSPTIGASRVYTHYWKSAGEDQDTDFLVTCVTGVVYFDIVTSKSNETPGYARKGFVIDLSSYKLSTSTATDVDYDFTGFASGKGNLFIVNKHIEPLRVEYNSTTDAITVYTIAIRVRDHYGLDDDLAVDEDPRTLSAAHHYNLLNQGWEYSGGGLTTPTGATGSGPGGTVIPSDPTTPDAPTGFPTPAPVPEDPSTPTPGPITTPPYRPPTEVDEIQYLSRVGYTTTNKEVEYSFPVFNVGLNQPNPAGPIYKYFATIGYYPSNAKVWWAGKNAEGVFDPALLQKTFFGNTRAARGHFIIDPFTKNRTAVSGIPGLDAPDESTRPDSVCFASGRVFFGHKTTIYMSPILETAERAGQCYQEADPTSEDISDLIPTDGGFIEIPDADYIIALKPLADGIVVLARNGIWFVNSGSQGFTALDYTVNKVSSIGIQARESAVIANDTLFWWTKQGIQAITPAQGQFGAIPGQFAQQNITEMTIKKFYSEINEYSRTECKGVYDPATSTVIWLYRNDATKKRYLLKYDLRFNAFIPQSVDTASIIPVDLFVSEYYNKGLQFDTFVSYLCLERRWNGAAQAFYYNLVNGNFVDDTFVDGRSAYEDYNRVYNPELPSIIPSTLGTYESYIESGYEVLEDAVRKKQVPFLGVFFRYRNGDAACTMTTKWSWANAESSNKWSDPVYAYRPQKNYWRTTEENLTNMSKYDIIYTRNKVRGSGRAIQFRFSEAREGYGFTLIGWHAFYHGNTVP